MNEIDLYKKLQGYKILYKKKSTTIIQVYDFASIESTSIVNIVEFKCLFNSIWNVDSDSNNCRLVSSISGIYDLPKKLANQYVLENTETFKKQRDFLSNLPSKNKIEIDQLYWILTILKSHLKT